MANPDQITQVAKTPTPRIARGNATISRVLTEDIILNFLKTKEGGQLYHRESRTLEFKEAFNFAGLADYFRDFAAFANNAGGYLVFGVTN